MKKIDQAAVMSMPFPADLSLAEQDRLIADWDRSFLLAEQLRLVQVASGTETLTLSPAILDCAFKGEL